MLSAPDAVARLSRAPGLGPRTAGKIVAAWEAGRGARDAMSFLQDLGASAALAKRAVDAHGGAAAADAVRSDPFGALRGLRGAGFSDVDALAAALAVPAAHPSRVAAALTDALADYGVAAGHAFLPWGALCDRALRGDTSAIRACVDVIREAAAKV